MFKKKSFTLIATAALIFSTATLAKPVASKSGAPVQAYAFFFQKEGSGARVTDNTTSGATGSVITSDIDGRSIRFSLTQNQEPHGSFSIGFRNLLVSPIKACFYNIAIDNNQVTITVSEVHGFKCTVGGAQSAKVTLDDDSFPTFGIIDET